MLLSIPLLVSAKKCTVSSKCIGYSHVGLDNTYSLVKYCKNTVCVVIYDALYTGGCGWVVQRGNQTTLPVSNDTT